MLTPKDTQDKMGPVQNNPQNAMGGKMQPLKVLPKLEVNQPGDEFEREADQVAHDIVQRKERGGGEGKPIDNPGAEGPGYRQMPNGQYLGTGKRSLQSGKRTLLSRKANSPGGMEVSSGFATQLSSTKGSGKPLTGSVKTEMESDLGTDLSNVRLHDNSHAANLSQQIHAKAFTHGQDVYFNQGQMDLSSTGGKELLAHELVHTQQEGGSGVKRWGGFIPSGLWFKPFLKSKHLAGYAELAECLNNPNSSIGIGASGDFVGAIQKTLLFINPEKYSFPLYGPDKTFGSETQRMIILFQQDFGILPNGIVGQDTIKKLDEIASDWEFLFPWFTDLENFAESEKNFSSSRSMDKVLSGEGPIAFAKRNLITVEKLVEWNPAKFPNGLTSGTYMLHAGESLNIADPESPLVGVNCETGNCSATEIVAAFNIVRKVFDPLNRDKQISAALLLEAVPWIQAQDEKHNVYEYQSIALEQFQYTLFEIWSYAVAATWVHADTWQNFQNEVEKAESEYEKAEIVIRNGQKYHEYIDFFFGVLLPETFDFFMMGMGATATMSAGSPRLTPRRIKINAPSYNPGPGTVGNQFRWGKLPFTRIQELARGYHKQMNAFFQRGIPPSKTAAEVYRELAYRMITKTGGAYQRVEAGSFATQSHRIELITRYLQSLQ